MLSDNIKTKASDQCQESESKRKKISLNSEMFLKFISLLHNLMGKFKYLFTMALTLNMEKKNFQDVLIQIGNVYKPDSIFFQKEQECSMNTSY